jgi:PAS domain-containing protein
MILYIVLTTICLLLLCSILFYIKQLNSIKTGLASYLEGNYFNSLKTSISPFRDIANNINQIIANISKEKEQIEEILQEQKLIKYKINQFFLQAICLYDKESLLELLLEYLYKIYYPTTILFANLQSNNTYNVFIKEKKDSLSSSIEVRINQNINNIQVFTETFYSNKPNNSQQLLIPNYLKDVNNILQTPIYIDNNLLGVIQIINYNNNFENNDIELIKTMTLFLANQLKIINYIQEEKSILQKYSSIINILNDGIIIFNENKNIIMENPAARDFFSLNQTKKNILINDIINNNLFSTINIVLFKPEKLILSGKIDELINLNTNTKTYILILRNITESKKKEREKTEILFLAITNLYNELKSITKKFKEEQSIERNIDTCFLITKKLVYYLEIDTGPLRLLKKKVSFNNLLEKYLKTKEEFFNTNNITLNNLIKENDCEISVEEEKIILSMDLLLGYIIEKTQEKKSINIEILIEEETLKINFLQDNYNYDKLEIFELTKYNLQVEKFMQTEIEITEINIELSYINHILVSHGGSFTIKNTEEGVLFILKIPF